MFKIPNSKQQPFDYILVIIYNDTNQIKGLALQKNNFLFLTDDISLNDVLDKILIDGKKKFNYLIHSHKLNGEHFLDLRNFKHVSNSLDERTIVIFNIEGNVGFYIINEFLKNDYRSGRLIIVIQSPLIDYYPLHNNDFYIERAIKQLLKDNSKHFILLIPFLLESTRNKLAKALDKEELFASLTVNISELIGIIDNVVNSHLGTDKTIYVVNNNLKKIDFSKIEIFSKGIWLADFVTHLPFVIKKHLLFANRLEHLVALKNIMQSFSKLIKNKTSIVCNSNLIMIIK